MGRELFCDFCRAPQPIESNLQKISVGDAVVGDACFNCASTLTRGLKDKIAEMHKMHLAALHPQQQKMEQPLQQSQAQSAPAGAQRMGPAKPGGV